MTRHRQMPFEIYAQTQVCARRGARLQKLYTLLLAQGPLTNHAIWLQLTQVQRIQVSRNTILRDLDLLLRARYLKRVDQGDRYEWGGGRAIRIWRYGIYAEPPCTAHPDGCQGYVNHNGRRSDARVG